MDAEFAHVPIDTRLRGPWSPEAPDRDWEGIVIRAPRHVTVYRDATPVIPVCGYWYLEMRQIPYGSRLTLVARDVDRDAVYHGPIGVRRDETPGPRPPVPPRAPDPGVYTDRHFNPNLTRCVGLPSVPAKYEVCARFAGRESNIVIIELALKR